jgi:uncharacterized delta-60 repeat protein
MASRLSLLFLVAAACGEVPAAPDAPIDAPEPDAAQGFTATVLTPQASVPFDGSNRIVVEVTRTGAFTGPVTISPVGAPPAGVTVTPATIDAGKTTGDVIVAGTAPLVIGGTVSLTLEAKAAGLPTQTLMLTNLPVTPKPGTLDTTFNGTGMARVTNGADDFAALLAMEVLGGNITVTGYTIGGLGSTRMTTMRFTSAGAVDATWNGGQLLRTGFSGQSSSSDEGIAIGHQNDGRHIVIARHNDPTGANVGVARFSTTGASGGIDFGNNGLALINVPGTEIATGGIVQADNKIVIVGAKDNHYMVMRVDASGALDTTFNSTGYERLELGTLSEAQAIVVDSSERLLIGGWFVMNDNNELILERRLADGSLDPAFGTAGRVFIIDPADEQVFAVRTRSDKIYLASNVVDGNTITYRVRRFNANGSLDTTYGTNGIGELPGMGGTALDMIVLNDGRVVTLSQSGTSGMFGRLTQSGAVDTLFGTGGTGFVSVLIGGAGAPGALMTYNEQQIVFCGADSGASPGPGTFSVVGRMWM